MVHDYPINSPDSFLFGFILDLLKPRHSLECDDLPGDDDFIINEYGYVLLDEDIRELIDLDAASKEYPWIQEKPEAVGWTYEFEVTKVYLSLYYEDVREVLNDDRFIFKFEYNAARWYLDEMKAKHQDDDTDFFDDLA